MSEQICSHIREITDIKTPNERVCDECIKADGRWLHLRTCQTCGVTLCCDSSPQKHMTRHFLETGHPVVVSAEPGEKWLWCYVDKDFIEYD